MKKNIYGIMAILFVLLFSNIAHSADVRGKTWGMTQEEVMHDEDNKFLPHIQPTNKSNEKIEYQKNVLGFPCNLIYCFENNKLRTVLFSFTLSNEIDCNTLFDKISRQLNQRFNLVKKHDIRHNFLYDGEEFIGNNTIVFISKSKTVEEGFFSSTEIFNLNVKYDNYNVYKLNLSKNNLFQYF